MALEYFPCYYSYRKKLAKLSDQEVGRLFRSLLEYGETGETEELTGRESVAFDFIADDIDRAKAAYDEKCSKNKKNIEERYERKRSNTNEYERTQNKAEYKTNTKTNTNNLLPNGSRLYTGAAVADYLNRVNPSASPMSIDELKAYEQEMGSDVCIRAFDIALDNKVTSWSYIKAILSKWQSLGVKCLADIADKDKKPETSSGSKKVTCTDYSSPDAAAKMRKDMEELDRIMRGGT